MSIASALGPSQLIQLTYTHPLSHFIKRQVAVQKKLSKLLISHSKGMINSFYTTMPLKNFKNIPKASIYAGSGDFFKICMKDKNGINQSIL